MPDIQKAKELLQQIDQAPEKGGPHHHDTGHCVHHMYNDVPCWVVELVRAAMKELEK